MTGSALLFATAPSVDGGPAAALSVGGTTLVGRLLGQLASLGIRRCVVVTRPGWTERIEAAADGGPDVTVRAAADLREDLLIAAEVAREAPGRLLMGLADALVHRRPLAVLLSDPRIQTGVLSTGSRRRAGWSYAVGSVRGRLVAASSPYHRVTRPNGYLLGFAVVAPADRQRLAAAAAELAGYAGDRRHEPWEEELHRKAAVWRAQLWRASLPPEEQALTEASATADPAALPLDDAAEGLLALRLRAAREDAFSVLVVGLVRSGAQAGTSALRAFIYARPLSADAVAEAVQELEAQDEDRLALSSAVKAVDGFFTTFFVSPYSRYIARFAARRGWTPNAMTTVSMVIGLLAAAAFAVGSRAGMIAGAVLLQAAFTVDCVDGQLARYTLTFSKLGAWLDSVFDRAKEYIVFAGLAIGASRGFHQDVWTLAAAALALQTFRHTIDFSFAAGRHGVIATQVHPPLGDPGPVAPGPALRVTEAPLTATVAAAPGGGALATAVRAPAQQPTAQRPIEAQRADPRVAHRLARRALSMVGSLDRFTPLRWARRIFLLPIGERFALISLTAALGSPRLTFIALLAWGGVVAVYAVIGRTLRSVLA
jgi:phosphatidylglycerophosphate synthase